MHRHFDEDLKNLKNIILDMAKLVDSQVDRAFEALLNCDQVLALETSMNDMEINRFENLIDETSEKIIALHQPVANDLRLIIAVLKINNDLERMGDICKNICERVPKLKDHKDLISESDIRHMKEVIQSMIKQAIESFINLDVPLAKKVIFTDDVVDRYDTDITNYYVDLMHKNNDIILPATVILTIIKNMERLADHATNIAEDVVFLKDGTIVKHRKELL